MERWLLTIEDHLAIEQVLVRYCVALDENDREAWTALFAPDAKFIAGSVTLRTPAEFEAYAQRPENPDLLGARHIVSNILTDEGEGDGAVARARSDVLVVRANQRLGLGEVVYVATYRDLLVHGGAGWLFRERRAIPVAGLSLSRNLASTTGSSAAR